MCMCCIFVVGLFEKVKICKLSKRPLIGDSVYIMVVVVQSLSYTGLFCDPVDCSPPGSSVREISQARILEWVAISFLLHWQAGSLLPAPPGKPTTCECLLKAATIGI